MNGTKKDFHVSPVVESGKKSDLFGNTSAEQSKKSSEGLNDPLLDLGKVIRMITENQLAQTEIMDVIVQHMMDLEKRVQILEGRPSPRVESQPPEGYR